MLLEIIICDILPF